MFEEVRDILCQTLQLRARCQDLKRTTALLGNVPELDSMAVVAVITALEEHYGFTVADDEISAVTFETVGSLVAFVEAKLAE